jgi:hypothetical protein
MSLISYFVALLTTSITFTSLLLILYTFLRDQQYSYTKQEGVPSGVYEDLSKKTACGVKLAFISAFALFFSVILKDPIRISMKPTIPATLTGVGLLLFLLSAVIIFLEFIKLANEEH